MGVEGIIADGPEALPKLPPVHNVLIVGAGLTGLATALALHRFCRSFSSTYLVFQASY
jgi:cation diffusion facilitator CzcD-associated flavoprotein CzcO